MTDPTQIPNLEAANEHLHRQLTAKDARIRELEEQARFWHDLFDAAIEQRDDLEAEVRNLQASNEHKDELIEFWVNSYHELNGEAA